MANIWIGWCYDRQRDALSRQYTTTFTSHTPGGVPVYTGERVAEGDEQQLIMAHLGALRRAEWNYVAVQRETALLSRRDLTYWGSSFAYRTFRVRVSFVSSLFDLTNA